MATTDRIVVGGDTTPSATAALRWAVEEASRTGAVVVVVHAFDTTGRADLMLEKDLDRSRRDARYRTQSWVVEALGDTDLEVPVVVSTPDGSVEEALIGAASRASMVVIGVPQHGRRRDLAERLSARCACPVVTVGADQALAG